VTAYLARSRIQWEAEANWTRNVVDSKALLVVVDDTVYVNLRTAHLRK
jgi:hypothetical protein